MEMWRSSGFMFQKRHASPGSRMWKCLLESWDRLQKMWRKEVEKKGEPAALINKTSQGAEVAVFLFFNISLTSAFPWLMLVSWFPPVPNRPLQSQKTRLMIAWMKSCMMTAQVRRVTSGRYCRSLKLQRKSSLVVERHIIWWRMELYMMHSFFYNTGINTRKAMTVFWLFSGLYVCWIKNYSAARPWHFLKISVFSFKMSFIQIALQAKKM